MKRSELMNRSDGPSHILDLLMEAAGVDDTEELLRLVVAGRKLPKTEDGAIVTPGMVVYDPWPDNGDSDEVLSTVFTGPMCEMYGWCYSTRAAAEAARKEVE